MKIVTLKHKHTKGIYATKNVLKTVSVLLLSLLLSCSNSGGGSKDDSELPQDGSVDITLTAGEKTFKLDGICGFASAGGAKYIGASQNGNNLKTFATYFNIDMPPSATTTYTLVSSTTDTDAKHITMNIAEIIPGSEPTLTEWASTDTSGTLTLIVEGNKITADLSGIILKASSGTYGYINGNTGDFANDGTLSGTLVFYKN